MKMFEVVYCGICGEKLDLMYLANTKDVDGKYIRTCLKCVSTSQDKLKEQRFVESYRGHKIYQKDGRYYPYWICAYSYDSLDACKHRIDDGTFGVVPAV